jgi:hypothetical protein
MSVPEYPLCDTCKESSDPKCIQCSYEEAKIDAVIDAIDRLKRKRKLNIGGIQFSLDESNEIIREPAKKKTKLGEVCQTLDKFASLCKSIEDPRQVKELHLGLRISLTFPNVDESVDDESSTN